MGLAGSPRSLATCKCLIAPCGAGWMAQVMFLTASISICIDCAPSEPRNWMSCSKSFRWLLHRGHEPSHSVEVSGAKMLDGFV